MRRRPNNTGVAHDRPESDALTGAAFVVGVEAGV
jgi:hypothetical protein